MLENFQVIEIKKTVVAKEAPLNVIVEPKRIRFVKSVIEVLGYPAYVRFLFNPDSRQFAVQVGKGNESNTVKFSKAKEEQKTAILVQNEPMMAVIRGAMKEWNPETKYIMTGIYSKEDKAVIFDLSTGAPYARRLLKKTIEE